MMYIVKKILANNQYFFLDIQNPIQNFSDYIRLKSLDVKRKNIVYSSGFFSGFKSSELNVRNSTNCK